MIFSTSPTNRASGSVKIGLCDDPKAWSMADARRPSVRIAGFDDGDCVFFPGLADPRSDRIRDPSRRVLQGAGAQGAGIMSIGRYLARH